MADQQDEKEDNRLLVYGKNNADPASGSGAGWFQQLKYGGDHSGNRCCTYFVANPGYLQFLALGSAGIGFIAVFLAAESYRLERLAIWRDPEKYEKGFQTIQAYMPLEAERFLAEA